MAQWLSDHVYVCVYLHLGMYLIYINYSVLFFSLQWSCVSRREHRCRNECCCLWFFLVNSFFLWFCYFASFRLDFFPEHDPVSRPVWRGLPARLRGPQQPQVHGFRQREAAGLLLLFLREGVMTAKYRLAECEYRSWSCTARTTGWLQTRRDTCILFLVYRSAVGEEGILPPSPGDINAFLPFYYFTVEKNGWEAERVMTKWCNTFPDWIQETPKMWGYDVTCGVCTLMKNLRNILLPILFLHYAETCAAPSTTVWEGGWYVILFIVLSSKLLWEFCLLFFMGFFHVFLLSFTPPSTLRYQQRWFSTRWRMSLPSEIFSWSPRTTRIASRPWWACQTGSRITI